MDPMNTPAEETPVEGAPATTDMPATDAPMEGEAAPTEEETPAAE